MENKKPGRPRVTGIDMTVDLNAEALEVLDQGAATLAGKLGNKPNRAAWIRGLIDFVAVSDLAATMSASLLAERWPAQWFQAKPVLKVTVRIEERQRMWLRQFECYVQSLDWTREIYRRDAVELLIAAHGPAFNKSMRG